MLGDQGTGQARRVRATLEVVVTVSERHSVAFFPRPPIPGYCCGGSRAVPALRLRFHTKHGFFAQAQDLERDTRRRRRRQRIGIQEDQIAGTSRAFVHLFPCLARAGDAQEVQGWYVERLGGWCCRRGRGGRESLGRVKHRRHRLSSTVVISRFSGLTTASPTCIYIVAGIFADTMRRTTELQPCAAARWPVDRPEGRRKGPRAVVQCHGQNVRPALFLHLIEPQTDLRRSGRSIADAFLELPPRDELPDYYQLIRMPVALDTIREKLKRNAYPTVTTLESDLKRMIQNAKEYNVPKSEIYEDAERIRKLVYNFMKVHNPAYTQDPNYTSFPTPLPEPKITLTNSSHRGEPVKEEPKSRDGSVKPRPSTAPKASEPPSERKSSVAPSSARDDGDGDDNGEEDENMDFTGKSFQEAQNMIISEAIRYTDEEYVQLAHARWKPANVFRGLEIFTPFVNLPSRRLEDYYKTIRHPVSLKGVQKRLKGVHGRAPPTGVTDFKTWDAFQDEVSFIWRNAREFNQDGSDMYNLAGEFEVSFERHGIIFPLTDSP